MLSDCGFFFLRTPALPYNTADQLTSAKLREICRDPYIREAIFVASPDLFEVFEQWSNGELTAQKEVDRLELTIAKYLLRMSYRSTPFGLFAGVSRGDLGPATKIELVAKSDYKKYVRLDMDYLCALALSIAQDPAIRNQLEYRPNTTVYTTGESMRFVEYKVLNKVRSHHLVSIDRTVYLQKALTIAAQGATVATISQALVDEDVTLEEAESFVNELVDTQLLVSKLEPIVTGTGYLETIIAVLSPLPACQTLVEQLTLLSQHLADLSNHDNKASIPLYRDIAAQLQTLGVSFEIGQLFQVDLRKPTLANSLNVKVVNDVRQAITLLCQLNSHGENEHLTKFKEAFHQKYEEAEVPLVQVLDNEMGIGYPLNSDSVSDNNPLLKGVMFGDGPKSDKSYPWTEWRKFLFDSYLEVVQTGKRVLTLTPEQVAPYLQPRDLATMLPASCYTMVNIIADSAEAVDADDYKIMYYSTSGPSAATLLARFCYLDEQFTDQLKECLQREAEAYPDALLAEIVHINQSRVGNVVIRPQLRPYEIPIMVQTGVAEDHSLPLQDLMVSIKGNTLVLRSKRLDKVVIPRLSTAHNYLFNTLPSYRFLCDMQHQDVALNCSWDWGILNEADFLPRVEFGKVILARARWMLRKKDITDFVAAAAATATQFMTKLRAERNIPRWVTYQEGDNELPIDLDNELNIRLLQSLLKNKEFVSLEESLNKTDTGMVVGQEGRFLNEVIFPLQNTSFRSQTPMVETIQKPVAAITRHFAPGSEWLYFKIYCGVKTADKILTECLKPIIEELQTVGLIDRWFFIRYADPGHHIRVRFHGDKQFFAEVIARLHQVLNPLLRESLISEYRTAIYNRELERYGRQNMENSEAIFWQDSTAVINILSMLDEGEAGDELRWLIALRGVDTLLNDFDMPFAERKELFDGLQDRSKSEFNAHAINAKKSLSNRYRKDRQRIDAILRPDIQPDDELYPIVQVLESRSQQWQAEVARVKELHQTGNLGVDYTSLIESYIHMFLNRMLRSQQRIQEMVLYDFLYQIYTSVLAQQRAAEKREAVATES